LKRLGRLSLEGKIGSSASGLSKTMLDCDFFVTARGCDVVVIPPPYTEYEMRSTSPV